MIFLSTKGTKCHTYTIKQKGVFYMSNQISTSIVKVKIHNSMKAKLKATAALNDMTMSGLLLDAVLEKYPYLKNEAHYPQHQKQVDENNDSDGEKYEKEKIQ